MDSGGDPKAVMGMLAGVYGFICCFGLIIYVYFSYSIMKIAQKLSIENAWMAWIPLVNLWVLVQCAGKPGWWVILCFVPIVSIIVMVIVWMAIAERRGKPSWIGILIIVPIVGLFVPGYLAFTE